MEPSKNVAGLTGEELQRAAENIYIYGYPLVLMDAIRRMKTATPQPSLRGAPINQFAHRRFLPSHSDKDATYPSLDTLSSSAWLDLHKDPVVLSAPQIDRYHVINFWSSWYEIFGTVSPRTPGRSGDFAFIGPHWRGSLPTGVQQVLSPTATVFIHGYFEVNGAEDIQLVHQLQDQLRLTSLRDWAHSGSPHAVPFSHDVDRKTAPQEQVARLGAFGFYSRLSKLLEKNPAQEWDTGILADFRAIGLLPGPDFSFETLPSATTQAMEWAASAAQIKMMHEEEKNRARDQTANGWSVRIHPGNYGTNYLQRAVDARSGIAVSLAEDAMWFHTSVDHAAQPLSGAHKYVIDFSRDAVPPVNALWSITLYDAHHHVARNDLHRYLVGDRSRLRVHPDNSISLYIQHEWPGESRDSNWLPTPKDAFSLALRLYWPKPQALTGKWHPPEVIRMN
jgi:hypothetical protein